MRIKIKNKKNEKHTKEDRRLVSSNWCVYLARDTIVSLDQAARGRQVTRRDATSRWRRAWRARMRVRVTRFAQTSWSRLYQASINGRSSSSRPTTRPVPSRPVALTRAVIAARAHACVSDTRGCIALYCIAHTTARVCRPRRLLAPSPGKTATRCRLPRVRLWSIREHAPQPKDLFFISSPPPVYRTSYQFLGRVKIPHSVILRGALRKA